ncbi:hypothetical protein [Escherichia coli]|uniref:hypothetical protein n=1 Tax=Escherichia coli TaxID=562 RepID=UPI00209AACBD|nr:hypothetical protein [Escherichia coli]MCO7957697.1 hypothetical protein [Escherichia coli]
MLCVTFEYHTDKMIRYISDLLIEGNGFGDIHNSKDIFIKAIGPSEALKTAVTAEWFERHKIELGYWGEEVL